MSRKEEIKKSLEHYKEKRNSVVKEIQEIDKRYHKGLIDLQLYYETILRNFGGNPKAIISEYDRKIDFCSNQLEKINIQRTFLFIIFSAVLLIAFFATTNQLTGFLIEIPEDAQSIPEKEAVIPDQIPQEQPPVSQDQPLPEEPIQEENAEVPEEQEIEEDQKGTDEITLPEEITKTDFAAEEEHERPVIGKPVRWIKRIKKEKEGRDEITLPKEADDIEVIKEDQKGKRRVGITGQLSLNIETAKTPHPGILKRLLNTIKKLFSKTAVTGKVAEEIELQKEENKKNIILDTPGVYEIIYYTPPPEAQEEQLTSYRKRVKISGPDFYTDILTFTTIPEVASMNEQESIKVYWLEENQYVPYQAEDTDSNGRIDKITWNTPHLSNQTFEITITILNVQSYPVVGGNWIVEFMTAGIANLTIKPAEGTTWSLDETGDLRFLEVKCGNNPLAYKWVDNTIQITDYTCGETSSEISLVLTEGEHTLEFDFGGIKKYAHNFAVGRRTGMIAYGEGIVTTPRYRIWNGTAFGSEQSANSVGGVIEWLRLKASPTKDEYLLLTADTGDDINIQINSSLNGVGCWHNGTTCGSVLELETTSSTVNRLKADIAYEQQSGDALVVFSDNTNIPKYRMWNGSSWSLEASVPQTLLPGTATYLKLVSKPGSDEIALLMTNTNNLNVMIWNGAAWTCEPPDLLSTVLTPEIFQYADIAYEQSSGDLFIASSVNGITEIDYTIKPNGTCSYTATRTTTLAEEGEAISVAPQYRSDYIMIAQHSIGGNDMQAIIWNGTTMLSTSGNELSLYAEASPNQLIASGWAGKSKRGVLVYSDAATSLNLDYMIYNTTENAWEGGTAGLDAAHTPFSDEEEYIQSYSFYEENKLLIIARDELDDLWAKVYNADTNSWSDADSGIALETLASSPEFPSYDFTWTLFEVNEPPNITFFSPSIPNIDLLENSTRNVSVTFLVTDQNGVESINASTAFVEFSRTGEQTRSSLPNSCTKTAITATNANITCIVPMEFYDAAGTWKLSASISDSIISDQDNATFEVNTLSSIAIISPPSKALIFPAINPESTNLQSTNDPLTIKNTGNHEGSIIITAYDIFGTTSQADKIWASNFAASSVSGNECTGTVLANATEITILGSMLPKGQSSTEDIFFCLAQVPSVIAQDYSTSAPGSFPWVVRILLVSIFPRRRKKQKEKTAIENIAKNILEIEQISKEHQINISDIINYTNLKKDPKEILVPLNIFSKELGILEAICKYLKDKCKMRYSEIAVLLERDDRTIWTSYKKAIKKSKGIKETTNIAIPLIELKKKDLSIFEAIVLYLRKVNYRYSEIASFLKRDERNIWTTVKRAEKKIKE